MRKTVESQLFPFIHERVFRKEHQKDLRSGGHLSSDSFSLSHGPLWFHSEQNLEIG